MNRIYFDNNATTPLDPRVFQAMLADLQGPPANPSSIHSFGRSAHQLLLNARAKAAHFFQAKPEEITFTSSGTEAINFFLRSLKPGHLITTGIEHSCIYRTCQVLETQGFSLSQIPVGLWGAPLPEDIRKELRPDTRALVLTAANAETGVRLDIEAVAKIAEEKNIPFLLDAVAYVGKEPLHIPKGVTAVAISGHKIHAPKGVGILFCRPSFKLIPLITGGGQEHLRRAGTENLSGILGIAEALEILRQNQENLSKQIRDLRDLFEQELFRVVPDAFVNGEGPRVSNVSNIAFSGVDAETLLMQLDLLGIATSHGSACSARAMEPSRVLLGMGIDRKTARSSLRFSFSRMNTREEVDRCVEALANLVPKLRAL